MKNWLNTINYASKLSLIFVMRIWGLEDFMNINKLAVYNAANLAMVNLSSVLLRQNTLFGISINDLKAWFRARKYVLDVFKLSEQRPNFN